jgi:anti-anti-sigma factor
MRSPLDLTVACTGSLATVMLAGEIDLFVVQDLDEALNRLGLRPGSCLIIDLTEATFADSTAIAWLSRAHSRSGAGDVSMMVLVATGSDVDRLVTARMGGTVPIARDARGLTATR